MAGNWRRQIHNIVWACLVFILGLGSLLRAADPQPRRVAVLEVGEEPVPAALVALMEAKLLEQEDQVALLERATVDRLLGEQELGLMTEGQVDAEAAIQTGKLWGVDAFCLISQSEKTLRVQMVDTWYGIRMMDVSLPLPKKTEIERTTDMISGRVLQRLSTVTRDPEELRMVGFLDVKSMEPSNRLDDLARPIRTAIEQQAQLQSGLIVAEREQVQPLLDERELVNVFPERIRSSVVLVDGEFHLDAENTDQLKLYMQGRRNGVQAFRFEVTGSLHDLELLGFQVATEISKALGALDSLQKMDPELEAEMLLAQSKASRDAGSSLGAAAAARGLIPDDERYEEAWLQAQYRWRKERPLGPEGFQGYIDSCRRILFLRLANPDYEPPSTYRSPFSLLDMCSQIFEELTVSSAEERNHFRQEILDLLETCWAAASAKDKGAPDFVFSAQWMSYRILKRIGPVNEEAAFLLYARMSKGASLEMLLAMSNELVWPEDLSKEECFQQSCLFYNWLVSRERSASRLAGKRGLARIHADPLLGEERYEKTRAYFEDFIDEFLNAYLPNAGIDLRRSPHKPNEYAYWISSFLNVRGFRENRVPVRYFADETKNLGYRADQIERILRQVLTDPALPQRVDWAFTGANLSPLDQAGRYQTKAELLQMILQYFEVGVETYEGRFSGIPVSIRDLISKYEGILYGLQAQHPEVKLVSEKPRSALEGTQLFSLDANADDLNLLLPQSAGALSPRRLVLEHGMAAVLCTEGVLFLDPGNLKPVRYQAAPGRMRLGSFYAADDSGIYAVCPDGIAFFPKSGEANVYFANHPDLSSHYFDVDVLNHRVYLLTAEAQGAIANNALEFNLETGTRTILLSTKSGLRDPEMRGLRNVLFVVSESETDRLHIGVSKELDGEYPVEIYEYDPEEKNYKRSSDTGVFQSATGSVKRRGTEVMYSRYMWVEFKELSKRGALLLHYKSRDHRFSSYGPITRVGKGMVGILPYRSELNYFPPGGGEMLKIKYDVFPSAKGPAPRLVDLATHSELGLLILASDGLYNVPTLRHPSGSGGVSWSDLQRGGAK